MHGISSRTDWGWCRCAGHGWPERSTPRSTSAQRCHGVHPCRYTTITTWNDPGRTIQTMGYLAHLRVRVPMCADVMFWLRAYSLVHSTVQRVSWWSPNQNCGSMVPFGGFFLETYLNLQFHCRTPPWSRWSWALLFWKRQTWDRAEPRTIQDLCRPSHPGNPSLRLALLPSKTMRLIIPLGHQMPHGFFFRIFRCPPNLWYIYNLYTFIIIYT